MKLASLVLVLSLSQAACSTFSIRADRCPAYPAPAVASSTPAQASVKVQYLGAGGYLVQRGSDVVLFGPQYSNPSLPEVAFDHDIRTDRALVERLLPADANNAAAIVIGHSHYDHLLDTPYIANARATKAKIYGSATMKNLISSAVTTDRLVDVGPDAASKTPVVINTRMRLWPIRSEHSDQTRLKFWLLGLDVALHMWRGEISEPQAALPARPSGWAEGEVYAYVLDFLDATGKEVEFRVYYQDSGSDEPVGYPFGDHAPTDHRPIDVALIVGGDFEHLKNHPEGIIKATNPRFLLLGHWDNFFEPQTDICRSGVIDALPRFDVQEFVGEAADGLKEAHLPGKPILPCPTASVFHFPVDKSNDAAIYKALKKSQVTYDCGK